MKMTLLEYVIDIMNDMDSDLVNSIFDTFESEQVAQIVKSSYFAMMSNRNWPHLKRPVRISASGNPNRPTELVVQDYIKELVMLNYDCSKSGSGRTDYREVKWIESDDFLRHTNLRDVSKPEVEQTYVGDGGSRSITYNIYTDRAPSYFTSFDDKTLTFDSYDSSVDSTLQLNKTQAIAYVMPEWEHVDGHIPDLPEEAVTALLEESKSRAMFKLKQMQDLKAESEANKQQRWLSRKAWRVNGGIKYPNYGRKGRKGSRDKTFEYNR